MSRPRQDRRGRTLPHNLDAEASILGGIILRNDALSRCQSLEPDDFYDPRHHAVFAAIRELEATARPIDPVTLEDALERAGKLDAIGGVAFIGDLAAYVPTPDNVGHYAEIVTRKRAIRDAMVRMSEYLEHGYDGSWTDEQMVEGIYELAAEQSRRRPVVARFVSDIVRDEIRRLDELRAQAAKDGEEVQVGIPTGLANLDAYLGGMPVGPPFAIAARPAGHKTTAGEQIAEYQSLWCAAKGRGLVVYCSNEDQGRETAHRSMSRSSGVPGTAIRRVQLPDPVWSRLVGGVGMAAKSRVLHVPIHGLTGAEVARLMRRVAAEHGKIAVVWIDYLQNMGRPRGTERDENQALTVNCQALGAMNGPQDGGLDCALGVLLQLKRKEGDDSPPSMEDLRGSGWLEQFVKVCVGWYHPWSHGKVLENPDVREDCRDKRLVTEDLTEGHVIKNSFGPKEEVLRFRVQRPCYRFEPWVDDQPSLPHHAQPMTTKARAPRGKAGGGDHPNAPGVE